MNTHIQAPHLRRKRGLLGALLLNVLQQRHRAGLAARYELVQPPWVSGLGEGARSDPHSKEARVRRMGLGKGEEDYEYSNLEYVPIPV